MLLNSYKSNGIIIKKIIIPKIKLYDKIYDGTTTINFELYNKDEISFKNILFNSKNVGYNQIIIYDLTIKHFKTCELNNQFKYYANIFKKELIPTFIITPKYYDGNNSVNIEKIEINSITNDLDTYEIYYEDINCIENNKIIIKNINLNGVDSINYFIKEEFILYSSILPLELDIEFIIEDKEYDGTNIGTLLSYNI